jgi:tetratricopeptide (TPR) repeat protein
MSPAASERRASVASLKPSAPPSRWAPWSWALALAAVVAIVLWPVLGARAIGLDDPTLIVANPLVAHPSAAAVGRVFVEVLRPTVMNAYYMPLSMASLALDAAWGGSATNLVPFHVTNLVLHLVAVVLLFLLLRRLTDSALAAALASLAYGVHPLMVEAVASAGERKTVLATALAFGALWAAVGEGRRARWAAWALYVLALLAKPSVITLPLVFVILDVWPLRRASRATLLAWWPFAATAMVAGFVASRSVAATWEFAAPPPFEPGLVALKAIGSFGFYAMRLLWPVEMSTVYAPPAPFALSNPEVLLRVGVAVACALGAWFVRRRAPAVIVGLLVFAVLLVPTFGILAFSPVINYDRYLHLPLAGLALSLAYALTSWSRASSARRGIVTAVMLLVCMAEAVGARQALVPWRDTLALWQRAVAVAPTVAPSHNGLGVTLEERGDAAGAIAAFERAIAVDPGYADAHYNLGRTRWRSGRADEALPSIERAALLAPGSGSVALLWGLCLNTLGRPREAIAPLRRALALRIEERLVAGPLGAALFASGEESEGLRWMRRAVEVSDEPLARIFLAQALGDDRKAAAEVNALLADALRRAPDSVPVLNEVAWWRATAPTEAERDTALALELSARAVERSGGREPAVLDTRAAAEAAAGRFDDAIATALRAQALAGEDRALAAGIAQRLAGYRAHRAFRRPAPAR